MMVLGKFERDPYPSDLKSYSHSAAVWLFHRLSCLGLNLSPSCKLASSFGSIT